MKNEMMMELTLLQKSRTYRLTGEFANRLTSSVKKARRRLTNRMAKRGQMLAMLDSQFRFFVVKNLRKRFK